MKRAGKGLALFLTGGALYYGIELLWRGYSHWTMLLVGGLCFLLVGLLNEWFAWSTPLLCQGVMGAAMITAVELAAGLILNIRLGLGVWDYSDMPLNFMGQICLPFSLLWILLAAAAVVLDDWLRHWWFGEERPTYTLF